MACVYEAEDQSIGRKVGLKFLMVPPAVPESEKSLLIKRFQQEARAAGTLSHSNVVTLFEVGEPKACIISRWNCSRAQPCGNCYGGGARYLCMEH